MVNDDCKHIVILLEVNDKNAQDKQDSCLSVTDWAKKQQENER